MWRGGLGRAYLLQVVTQHLAAFQLKKRIVAVARLQ